MKSDILTLAGGFFGHIKFPESTIHFTAGLHDIYLTRISPSGMLVVTTQGGIGDEQITGFALDDN